MGGGSSKSDANMKGVVPGGKGISRQESDSTLGTKTVRDSRAVRRTRSKEDVADKELDAAVAGNKGQPKESAGGSAAAAAEKSAKAAALFSNAASKKWAAVLLIRRKLHRSQVWRDLVVVRTRVAKELAMQVCGTLSLLKDGAPLSTVAVAARFRPLTRKEMKARAEAARAQGERAGGPELTFSCEGGGAGAASAAAAEAEAEAAAAEADGDGGAAAYLQRSGVDGGGGGGNADPATCDTVELGPIPSKFTFSAVLPPETPQALAFDRAAAPMVDKAIAGFSSAILCYGRTGAGKTHTLYGEVDSGDAKGFAPRALERMLAHIAKEKAEATQWNKRIRYAIEVSFLEIYGEDIFDLLDEEAGTTPLEIKGLGMNAPFASNPSKRVAVRSAKDVAKVMAAGEKHREITANLDGDGVDQRASQSHTVLSIFFTKKHGKDSVMFRSILQLVDLAGSEAADPARSPLTAKALASLGAVVQGLSARKARKDIAAHGESKLTQLLAPGMGGSTAVLVVANCVAADGDSLTQSLDTLAFGRSTTEAAPAEAGGESKEGEGSGGGKSHILQRIEAAEKLMGAVIDLKIDVEDNLDECGRMHAGYEGVDEMLKMKCLALDKRCSVLEEKRLALIHDEVA